MKKLTTQMMMKIAVLAAIAAVLMSFDFPVPFAPPFYKLDFSEVIVMLAGFSLGVIPAIAVEALKIILSTLINGTETMGIGEFANFVMGCSFVIPATYIYHKNKTRKQAMFGLGVSILSLCIVASLMNYFILLPIYAYFFDLPIEQLVAMGTAVNGNITSIYGLIALAVIPFNLVKGISASLIVILIYKKVTPVLKS